MQPPRILEATVSLLLPSTCREHVLGDLQERYRGPTSYLLDALAVLPPLIMSRIRRNTDFQVFIMETLTVYLSFMTTAWYFGDRDFLYRHAGFVRLALPAAVAAVALLFCNAYSDPAKTSYRKPLFQSAISLSLAFLGQALLFDASSNLVVPFRTLLIGSLLSAFLTAPMRMFFPTVPRSLKLTYPTMPQPLTQHRLVSVSYLQQFREKVNEIRSLNKSKSVLKVIAVTIAVFVLLALLGFLEWKLTIPLLIVLLLTYRLKMQE